MRTRPLRRTRPDPTDRKERCVIATKVFVGNLSFDTTDQEIQDLFSQVAGVVSVSVPADRLTGRRRGFAFVEFAQDEQAAAAIARFDGAELGGRRLRVNEASDRPARFPASGGPRPFASNDRFAPRSRPKGSRRNVRARKRSIW